MMYPAMALDTAAPTSAPEEVEGGPQNNPQEEAAEGEDKGPLEKIEVEPAEGGGHIITHHEEAPVGSNTRTTKTELSMAAWIQLHTAPILLKW
jgi:hypothetical protein